MSRTDPRSGVPARPTPPARRTAVTRPAPATIVAGHPFRFPYIGLGLLDESSIARDADTGAWTADYPYEGEPYLRVRVGPGERTRIEELDADGRSTSLSMGPTLGAAIGQHAMAVALVGVPEERLGGAVVTRFWRALAFRTPGVWVDLSSSVDVRGFVPAIGIGLVTVPVPLGQPFHAPEPGPIARRIGLEPHREPFGAVLGTMLRWYRGHDAPDEAQVRLHRWIVPGILVGELVAAIRAANGPLRSIEWRPYLLADPRAMAAGDVRAWDVRPGSREHGLGLERFGIAAPPVYLPVTPATERPA